MKFAFLIAAVLSLPSPASAAQGCPSGLFVPAATQAACQCQQAGFEVGSEPYAQCFTSVMQNRRAAAGALSAFGRALMATPPRQRLYSCTTTRTGNFYTTSCF